VGRRTMENVRCCCGRCCASEEEWSLRAGRMKTTFSEWRGRMGRWRFDGERGEEERELRQRICSSVKARQKEKKKAGQRQARQGRVWLSVVCQSVSLLASHPIASTFPCLPRPRRPTRTLVAMPRLALAWPRNDTTAGEAGLGMGVTKVGDEGQRRRRESTLPVTRMVSPWSCTAQQNPVGTPPSCN